MEQTDRLYHHSGMDNVYSNNMMFQQNSPITITGHGIYGTRIAIKLVSDKDSVVVRAANGIIPDNGIWELSMEPLSASFDTYTLNFFINDRKMPEKKIENVIIGDLYLASGQSNMVFKMWETKEGADWHINDTYSKNGNPNIRILCSDNTFWNGAEVPYAPYRNGIDMRWTVGNQRDSYDVSAVAYHFADWLQKKSGIPIGVMDASLGGCSVFSWISRSALETDDLLLNYLKGAGKYFDKNNWSEIHPNNNAQQKMTSLYNIKIAPLNSLEISGVIWYQGCNEVGIADGVYTRALEVLRKCFAETFNYIGKKLPFLFVELHAYGFIDPSLPNMWEQMTIAAQNNENMGAITIYDLPPHWDYTGYTPGNKCFAAPVHPYTKKPVGTRLAKAMYTLIYDSEYGEITAPTWNGEKVIDGKYIYLNFDHVGAGIGTPNNVSVKGFSIADAKGVFANAKAEIIDDNTVKVWNDLIDNPIYVSYCYDNLSITSNLYGTQNGNVFLPVAPFVTEKNTAFVYAQNNSWYNIDSNKIIHFIGTKFVEYNSWSANGAIAQVVNDVKVSNEGALKINYTNSVNQFDASPKLLGDNGELFSDINYDYSIYNRIAFKVKNMGVQINLEKLGFYSNGIWYFANIFQTLSSKTNWIFIIANFNNLTDENGNTINNLNKLSCVTNIKFVFSKSSGAGAAYISEIQMGI